ncbi:MAG: hypothetical protein NC402_05090 [Prevotella sp.]|nr:hypothetical protein [Prevotella sp.]MCM1074124.1 hypothetical protein [Ruminococcus sp.]
MTRGSISAEEFSDKVMGKVWYKDYQTNEPAFVDSNGDSFRYYDYALSGGNPADPAYYFDEEKYVRFYYQPINQHDENIQHRYETTYKYDHSTGMVYADNGEIEVDGKKCLFYIESVKDDTMVIHYEYTKKDFTNDNADTEHYNIYCRQVLKAASENDAKRNWWDEFKPDK